MLPVVKYILPILIAAKLDQVSGEHCALRAFKTGYVCVCNATFCDTLAYENPKKEGEVLILSTSENRLRFKESRVKFNTSKFLISDFAHDEEKTADTIKEEINGKLFNWSNQVSIDRNRMFQTIVGFGNALTGAVIHNLLLAPTLQENVFRSYFSKESGNGFNIIRTPIGGCDFDLEPWAYNELPEHDGLLSNFTKLDARDVEKSKFIKRLIAMSGNSEIKFVGTAWSSPKWMKTNNAWTGYSSLKDEYYQTWANYHVKFMELMHEEGINFWAMTTGNEPLNGVTAFLFIAFMSLGWLPRNQGKWVSENLGPSLRRSETASNIKILAGDDQRYTFPWWFDQMYQAYPLSKSYVDGHAVHWYWDKYVPPRELDRSHQNYPEKLIIATEACSGDKPWEEHRPVLGYWPRAHDYIVDIIQNLNHHANAWIDWNMVLDENGGPNYANNFVDSPIVVNTTSREEFYKQPTFYAMGHFSRFIIENSVRIFSQSSSRSILSTAFLRPDGLTVVVLYNSYNRPAEVEVKDPMRGFLKLEIPAKSIHSLLYP